MDEKNAEIWVSIQDLVPTTSSDIFQRFIAHWINLRKDQLLPTATQFDPTDVPWALSHTFLIDVLEGDDFIYRLASESHNSRYGRNLKGARFSDFMDEAAAKSILHRMRIVRDTPAGFFVLTSHTSTRGLPVNGERLVLPLGDENMRPCRIIGLTQFSNPTELNPNLIGDQQVHVMRFADLKAG